MGIELFRKFLRGSALSDKVFLLAILLLCISSYVSAAEEITDLYESEKVVSLISGVEHDGWKLIDEPIGANAEDLPAELVLITQNTHAPVIESLKLTYPVKMNSAARIKFIQIWVAPEYDKKALRQIYSERVDQNQSELNISFSPFAASTIHIKFFNVNDEESSVLPRVTLYGEKDASTFTKQPQPGDNFNSNIYYSNNESFGNISVACTTDPAGFIFQSVNNSSLEQKDLLNTVKYENITGQSECEIKTDLELNLDSFYCADEISSWEFSGEVLIDTLRLSCKGYRYSKYELDTDIRTTVDRQGNVTTYFSPTTTKEIKPNDRYFFDQAPETPFVISVLLYDRVVYDGLIRGASYQYDVLTPIKCKPIRITAKVLESIRAGNKRENIYVVWFSDKKGEEYDRVSLIDENGMLLREFDYTTGLEFKPDNAGDSVEIDKVDEQENKNPIPHEWDVSDGRGLKDTASIRLHWYGIPGSLLNLDSSRQKLISLNESELGVFEADIETISRKENASLRVEEEDILPEELMSYLLFDNTLDSKMDELLELADQIIDDTIDPLQKVTQIHDWLNENVEYKNECILKTQTATTILRNKEGDCKYYSLLFATLARIAGIPTRFVIGQRYQDGNGFYIWNQIFIDNEWLDIDASNPDFYPDALYVQMFIGPSLNNMIQFGSIFDFAPKPLLSDISITN